MVPGTQEIDRWTRNILRAVEPDLRRHLGSDGLGQRLVSDLYLAVRENLTGAGLSGNLSKAGFAEDLAMAIYVVSVSRSEVSPALLAAVTRTIERSFGGPKAPGSQVHYEPNDSSRRVGE